MSEDYHVLMEISAEDVKKAVDALEKRDAEIERLRAELAAEREECLEQARLNGMGAERELKLMAERDALRALLREAGGLIRCLDPRDAFKLLARIDAALNKGDGNE